MSNKNKHKQHNQYHKSEKPNPITTLLDKMEDGREFESLLKHKAVQVDIATEIRKALQEVKDSTKRDIVCYLANNVNSNIKAATSIVNNDDLPFKEMISSIDKDVKEIDIILVTPGGTAQQVAKFVDTLRPRFDHVNFMLPNMAMSAGTIFSMSGNNIFMGPNSYIGPIDPQVPNKNGNYVPAQSLLTLIADIRERGEGFIKKGVNPPWTDLQILKQIDPKEIGNALSASNYSIELVENYLYKYKFQDWITHESSGKPVTDKEKKLRAKEIPQYLCDHNQWKSHSRGITREEIWSGCHLKIEHFETIPELDRAMRRFWALMYWIFENTPVAKLFISEKYCIIRQDKSLLEQRAK